MAVKLFEVYGEALLKGKSEIKNDLGDIDKRAKGVGGTFSKIGPGIAKAGKGIAKAFAGASMAVAGLAVKMGKDSLNAYAEQERAEMRLAQIMETVTGATEGQVNAIKAYASELQKTTVIGDEVAISGASQLASFGANEQALKTLMPAMNDLAVATYGANVNQDQMIQTANMMGKALQGQVGALTRAGVLVSDKWKKALEEANTEEEKASILSEILKENYGGLAEAAANTAEGGMQQLKNQWGDMKEQLGAGLLPVQQQFISLIQDNMPMIQETMTRVFDAIIPVLQTLAETVLPAVMELLPVFADLFENVVAPAIDALLPLFTDIIEKLLPPFIDLFSEIMEKIMPPVVAILEKLFEALTPILDIIMDIVSDTVLPILNTLFEALTPILDAVFAALGPLFDALKPIFDVLAELTQAIMPVLNMLFDALRPILDMLKPAFEALELPLAVVADALSLIISSIKWIIDNIGAVLGLNEYQSFGFDFNNTATLAAAKNLAGARANGGPINRPGMYLVGERGPEVVELPQGAYVRNNDDTRKIVEKKAPVLNIYNNNNPSPYEVYRSAKKQSAILALS